MDGQVAVSLLCIVAIAAAAPLLAGAIRGRPVPEVVLLVVAGSLIGPHGLGLAATGPEIDVLSELGMGMLFLLAGYELDPAEVAGPGGRRAVRTWLVSLILAFATVAALHAGGVAHAGVALAIAMTSTALGTLIPILKARGLTDGPIGRAVLNHGAVGELGPVLAMAVLLGVRGPGPSLLLLVVFLLVVVVVWAVPGRILRIGRVSAAIRSGADGPAQTTVRLVVLLLVALIAVAAVFDLDVILGAFAAGIVLRRMLPRGDPALEDKLSGIGFGLLIPIFFVVSGMGVDTSAVLAEPVVFLAFLGLLVLVRGVPVLVSTGRERDADGAALGWGARIAIGAYGTTGLPIIVAVTGVAVAAGEMSAVTASVLIAAGAVTVLVMPLIGLVAARGAGTRADPVPESAPD